MSLWSRLKGGAKREYSESELATEADFFLRQLEQEIVADTKSAIKRMIKRPKHLEPLFDFNGPLYDRFAGIVLTGAFCKRRDTAIVQKSPDDLPSVQVITDHEAATLGQVLQRAAKSEAEVIFIRFIKEWPPDVLAAVEALYELAIDPDALFCIHSGPDNVFVRKNFLLSAAPAVKGAAPAQKAAEELFLYGEAQPDIEYDDYVLSAFGYVFCKFFRKES
ncbi:MAG: hypothetical protein C4520_13410 [Candidatus Abyssobacteria bacterium SURF_5]|uniref:Uncharacterized protein n=1 Tax=Abyssobacteria bacterium (strain SURF_5) TaxID=2093360 RepID=A0A3A4NQ32_ABYX5|nr:MAG: hypothetical protein C4520_13410 [Candidatus Abyssubacteria bacterium SURF_5]